MHHREEYVDTAIEETSTIVLDLYEGGFQGYNFVDQPVENEKATLFCLLIFEGTVYLTRSCPAAQRCVSMVASYAIPILF